MIAITFHAMPMPPALSGYHFTDIASFIAIFEAAALPPRRSQLSAIISLFMIYIFTLSDSFSSFDSLSWPH